MYEDLMKRYKEQDPREVFAHFSYKSDLGETWETPIQKLAEKARPECWNFEKSEFKKEGINFPILSSYLNFTFKRLQEQKKINYSTDGNRACFNTGLQTPEGKDIFATFYKNQQAKERNQPDWTLFGYFDAYSDKVRDFEPLPDIATYIDNPSDLVFDYRLQLEVDYKHILVDNVERLPDVLKEAPTLARHAVEGAISQLRERLKRNYKLAVPHWYEGKVQLLLPLSITDDISADVALVAEKDEQRGKYMVRTVLTMDMAYQDARIICAPDRQWLNP
ncbi:DUF3825 domain-containing protein [Aeromonas jandaei]|uniref:DUF3825 domain-containing protein n=1 Tax=Aeromonas jandaei TaxID=650 RepID=A0ABD7EM37_AERJA|nr:DUF3825 domain-containing protein [Aeromonas jandaei]QWL62120.1 DUF3825 domain-containing protein [Aeromonas jandaei]